MCKSFSWHDSEPNVNDGDEELWQKVMIGTGVNEWMIGTGENSDHDWNK